MRAESQSRFQDRTDTLPALLALLIGGLISALLYILIQETERQQVHSALQESVYARAGEIQDHIDTALEVMRGVVGLYAATGQIGRDEFRTFVKVVRPQHPEIDALMWAPLVPANQLAAHEADMRAEGDPEYRVRGDRSRGGALLAGHYPIVRIAPEKHSQELLGLDVAADPTIANALMIGGASGQLAFSGYKRYVSAAGEKNVDARAFLPMYRAGDLPPSDDRTQSLLGFVGVSIDLAVLVENALQHRTKRGKGLDMYLLDAASDPNDRLLYFHASRLRKDTTAPEPEPVRQLLNGQHVSAILHFGDRQWRLIFKPLPGYFDAQQKQSAWMALIGGLLLTFGLVAYLQFTSIRRRRAERLLGARDRQLADNQERIHAVLDNVLDGIITISEHGVIESFNPAAERIFGYSVDEAIGKNVKFLMPDPFHAEHDGYLRHYCETGEARVIGIGREVEGRRKDGTQFPLDLAVSEMQVGGQRMFTGIVRDITRRVRSASELKISEERLALVTKGSSDGFWDWDLETNEANFSLRFEELLGYRQGDLARNVEEFFDRFHPDDQDATRAAVREHFRSGAAFNVEVRLRCNGGSYRWFLIRGKASRNESGWVVRMAGSIVDSTVRVKIEQALRQATSLRQAILDSANLSIISTDSFGTIITFNRAAQVWLGYTEDEILGKETPAIIHDPEEVAAHARLLSQEFGRPVEPGFEVFVAKARLGIPDEHEWTYVRSDGSRFPVRLSVTALRDEKGAITGFLGVASDITERRKIDQMKNEFISVVSHELRTPLTSIRGSLGLLAGGVGGQLSEQGQQLADIACNNTDRLVRLINDILDIEKIEAGKMAIDMRPTDINSVIEQALQAIDTLAGESGIKLVYEPSKVRVLIDADADRLVQVVTNLLSNAIKFSPGGGVVRVVLKRVNDQVHVSVTDQGPGIPEAFRASVFQKFAQADGSDTRKIGGTGLGLAICKALVERMEGTIGFETESGVGSTFYFGLPVQHETSIPLDRSGPESASVARILIVEDNTDIAKLLKVMLVEAGFQSDVALNVGQARELLKSGNYIGMTLDIMLPDEDGLSFMRELRADPATHDLPIVVVSAVADESRETLNGNAIGIVDWLDKPIDQSRLISAVEKIRRDSATVQPHILHVEDDADLRQVVAAVIGDLAVMERVATLADARRCIETNRYDLVLLDIGLPDGNGLELLSLLGHGRQGQATPVVVFSARPVSAETAGSLASVLVKSRTSNEQLLDTITRALGRTKIAGLLKDKELTGEEK